MRRFGLTLIELLIVIGIIAVLAGIIWVVLAPAREKARLIHCINNFRQIHLAIESYRQDWEGVDVETATNFADLGLPPEPCQIEGFFPFYKVKCIGDYQIWKCPAYGVYRRAGPHLGADYLYVPITWFMAKSDPRFRTVGIGKMEKALRERKGDFPLVMDDYHDPDFYRDGFLQIFLRLSGEVEVKKVPSPSPVWLQ